MSQVPAIDVTLIPGPEAFIKDGGWLLELLQPCHGITSERSSDLLRARYWDGASRTRKAGMRTPRVSVGPTGWPGAAGAWGAYCW
jgi:hypothetical protein